VAPLVRVDLAARSPVDPTGPVDPADMNRVVAATVGTAAVTARADLASRAVPVVRVGMIPADPVDMIPGDPEDPVGMIPAVPVGMILGDPEVRLRAPNPVVRVDPEVRLQAPNPVVLGDPGNREATDLSLGRALLGRMPMRRVRMPMGRHPTAARPVRPPMLLHPKAAGPVPMQALLHLTPVDRRRDPTRQEAPRAVPTRRAEATRAEAARRAEATHRLSETASAQAVWRRQVRFCRQRYLTPSTA
jgi:hypothetical protein